NLSSPSNGTQNSDWNYYEWCTRYSTALVIWSTVSAFCFLLGFPASLWVLHELIQRQRQRSTSDVLMLSLAGVDLLFTAQIPICVFNFMIWHVRFLQSALIFVYSFNFIGRPLFLGGICWDCYVAVVHPIVYKTSKKVVVVKKVITMVVFCIMSMFGLLVCQMPRLITTPLMATPLMVVLPVIAFCDISILLALRKPDPTGKNEIHPQKKQALHTIFNSLIMTFIIYLPPMLIFSLGNWLFGEMETYCCSALYGFTFSTIGCVIIPVRYLISVGKLDAL
ncbi:G-protein coupled receptor 35-like, partial [Silurus asotus]